MPTAKECLSKLLVSLEDVVKTLDVSRPAPLTHRPGIITSDERVIADMLLNALSQTYAGDAAATQANTLTMCLGFPLDGTLKKGDTFSYGSAVHATVTDVTPKEAQGQGTYLVNVILGKNPVGPLPSIN